MIISDQNKGVTVVIPCRNEEKYIEKCILSLIDGTSYNVILEILVVDGMSSDKTKDIVEQISLRHSFVKRIENPAIETQLALNLGVRNANLSHLMIAGAHSEFPHNYIETLLSYMEQLNADGVGGSLKTDVMNKTKTSIAISRILSHPAGVGNSMFRIGADKPVKVDTVPFGIYKKELFDEVGYYNEMLKRNHDIEWSKRIVRAGKSIYLIPEMQCTYYARETYKALAANNYRNGLWNIMAVCITRTFRSLSLRHFIPFGFIGTIILAGIVGIFFLPALIAGVGILGFYLIVVSIFSVRLSGKGTTFLHLVLGFVVLHFSYGLGSIVGVIRGVGLLFRKSC